MSVRDVVDEALARRGSLRPALVPTVVGAATTVATGLLAGNWRSGALLGGSIATFWGALEYLHARGNELRGGGRR